MASGTGKSGKGSKPGDDDSLWQRVAAGIKPIDRNRRPEILPPTTKPVEQNGSAMAALMSADQSKSAKPKVDLSGLVDRHKPSSEAPGSSPQISRQPTTPAWNVHGLDVPGVDARTAGRFSRGQMVIDATLDLHGSRQADAQRQLQRFIAQGVQAGHRCLLVITGKGKTRTPSHSSAPVDTMSQKPGVIKRRLLDWLALPGMAEHILAVKAAQPRHGGGGAFYVLLKRKR